MLRNSPRGIGAHSSISTPRRVISALGLLAGILLALFSAALPGTAWLLTASACVALALVTRLRSCAAVRYLGWVLAGLVLASLSTQRWLALCVPVTQGRVLLEGTIVGGAGARGRRDPVRPARAHPGRRSEGRRGYASASRTCGMARCSRGASRRRTVAPAGTPGAPGPTHTISPGPTPHASRSAMECTSQAGASVGIECATRTGEFFRGYVARARGRTHR